MKVKGTIISSLQGFIKEKFPNRYDEWIDTLPLASRDIYSKSIMATEWYPYQDALIKPSEAIARLFYSDDVKKAAWDAGRHSAEVGLKGIYKVFILIATPQFIMKRAGKILASFYSPATLQVIEERPTGADLHLTDFPDPSVIPEYRIAGWMEKALEIFERLGTLIEPEKVREELDELRSATGRT